MGLLGPVETAEVEDDEEEQTGDAQADTEGQHQHQHPLVRLTRNMLEVREKRGFSSP